MSNSISDIRDEIAMVLFTNGWDFVTSFYKHRDDLAGEDEF